MNWWRRLAGGKQLEQHLSAELSDHWERQVADNIRAGMNADEARRQARIQFGGMEQVKEECRDARGTGRLESAIQDVREEFQRASGTRVSGSPSTVVPQLLRVRACCSPAFLTRSSTME